MNSKAFRKRRVVDDVVVVVVVVTTLSMDHTDEPGMAVSCRVNSLTNKNLGKIKKQGVVIISPSQISLLLNNKIFTTMVGSRLHF